MKLSKIMLVILVLCSISVLLLSCSSESESAVLENQTLTVQRGDLTVDITAVGNLSLSLKEDIAFETSGTVEEVMVEEGDSVTEGQVLVKLDTSKWEEELVALEDDLLQAEINLKNAEVALENAQDSWLQTLSGGSAVTQAKYYLEYAQWMLSQATTQENIDLWTNEVDYAKRRLTQAEASLRGLETEEVTIKRLQVEQAQRRLEDAQKELDEAETASLELTAPFDGFITMVNVEGGDEVNKGTVAVVIADPDKFEADILVGETDIFYVTLGGQAWVQVDALEGVSLPAKVTHISPTATIQSGVVNYTVRVELESLEAYMQEQREAMQEAGQGMMQGELPEELQQAIEEGTLTEEQLEEMREQMQQMQEQGGSFGAEAQEGQVTTRTIEDYQLKEGLTVTVSVVVEERTDVLLVLSSAISYQGSQAYVTVVSSDGSTEERVIQTGISNWQYTEVTDGLTEGEQYAIPEGTTTTTTTQPEGRGEGGMIIPGMGGFGQ
jgi:HlyD family secretion protein